MAESPTTAAGTTGAGQTDQWGRIGTWLQGRLPAESEVRVEPLGGPASIGYSAETVILSASFDSPSGPTTRRLVLRSETPDPPVYPPQFPGLEVQIDIQRRIMAAVAAAAPDVPVAPLVGWEPDPGVIGHPFFVMDFVDGDVPAVDPPYTAAGFFATATPTRRKAMLVDGLRTLAAVHRLDWQQAGLGWLIPAGADPNLERQLDLWEQWGLAALGERRHLPMESAIALLRRHLRCPTDPVLCWGDPRPGNMIWQDGSCACVTDWEGASISPPELDVAWWLMFDRCSHEVIGVDRLDGEPSREEQADVYSEASGRAIGDLSLHQIFAAYRYCAIVVHVMNRSVARGLVPADHEVWLHNPAATCLDQLTSS